MLEKNEKDLEVVEVSEPVEETKVETPVEVVEEPLPEEVEVIEYELGVTVEEETYVEYFKKIAFKSQIKPSLLLGVAIVLFSYFFRGEQDAVQALLTGLIWGAVFVIISIGSSYFMLPKRAKTTYAKSGINGLVLQTKFTNIGITQTLDSESITYRWESIRYFIESDTTFYGHMLQDRRILLFSKKKMTEEDITRIHDILVEHLGAHNVMPLEKKK